MSFDSEYDRPEFVCSYCEEQAVFETNHIGIYVCDDPNCIVRYAMEECMSELEAEEE